jgi:hypothetical protein
VAFGGGGVLTFTLGVFTGLVGTFRTGGGGGGDGTEKLGVFLTGLVGLLATGIVLLFATGLDADFLAGATGAAFSPGGDGPIVSTPGPLFANGTNVLFLITYPSANGCPTLYLPTSLEEIS